MIYNRKSSTHIGAVGRDEVEILDSEAATRRKNSEKNHVGDQTKTREPRVAQPPRRTVSFHRHPSDRHIQRPIRKSVLRRGYSEQTHLSIAEQANDTNVSPLGVHNLLTTSVLQNVPLLESMHDVQVEPCNPDSATTRLADLSSEGDDLCCEKEELGFRPPFARLDENVQERVEQLSLKEDFGECGIVLTVKKLSRRPSNQSDLFPLGGPSKFLRKQNTFPCISSLHKDAELYQSVFLQSHPNLSHPSPEKPRVSSKLPPLSAKSTTGLSAAPEALVFGNATEVVANSSLRIPVHAKKNVLFNNTVEEVIHVLNDSPNETSYNSSSSSSSISTTSTNSNGVTAETIVFQVSRVNKEEKADISEKLRTQDDTDRIASCRVENVLNSNNTTGTIRKNRNSVNSFPELDESKVVKDDGIHHLSLTLNDHSIVSENDNSFQGLKHIVSDNHSGLKSLSNGHILSSAASSGSNLANSL